MYARLAAFEGGNSEQMRKMSEERLASGSPFPEAVKRAVVLSTPEGDRRLFITFFDTEEELIASEEHFEKMGGDMPEEVRGTRIAVESYEVLLDWSA